MKIFGMGCIDLREWIALLENEGELHRITAQVDWDCEIGSISRRVLEKQGPGLLFENVKDHAKTRGRKVFCGGIGTRARLALALGFPKDATNNEIVQHVRKHNREEIQPVVVADGPVRQNIVKGNDVDLLMSRLQTSSVIWSVENVRERVTQRLTNVPEYRAFLAIEMPIAEVSQIPDLLAHLETVKQKILDRLNLIREYQSLLTVDKVIKEISEVLEFLGEEGTFDAMPAQGVAPAPLANTPTAIPSVVELTGILHKSFAPDLLAS